jgi:hypothetical protein
MGAVAVGVGEQAPETERPAAAAPMQVHLTHQVVQEERLLRRDVVILQVEAARLRRRARRSSGALSRAS